MKPRLRRHRTESRHSSDYHHTRHWEERTESTGSAIETELGGHVFPGFRNGLPRAEGAIA
jgi:hypothetical protein